MSTSLCVFDAMIQNFPLAFGGWKGGGGVGWGWGWSEGGCGGLGGDAAPYSVVTKVI